MTFKDLDNPSKLLLWFAFIFGIAILFRVLNVPIYLSAFLGGLLGAAFATWIGLKIL